MGMAFSFLKISEAPPSLSPTLPTFRPGNNVLSHCPEAGEGEVRLSRESTLPGACCVAQSDTQLPTHDTKFKLSGLLFLVSRPFELRGSQAAEHPELGMLPLRSRFGISI